MNPKRRLIAADEPIWLVVQHGDCVNSFELPANSRKLLIVGSSVTADVKVANAPTVACFLERDGESLWLLPGAQSSDLRFNTLKLEAKQRIYTRGLLELAGTELMLQVRDTPPTLRADGLTRVASEICVSHAKQSTSVDQLATTVTIDTLALRAALKDEAAVAPPLERTDLSSTLTKTVEMGPLEFDGWFDAAVEQGGEAGAGAARASLDDSPVTPIVTRGMEDGKALSNCPGSMPNVKTQVLTPVQPLPVFRTQKVTVSAPIYVPGECRRDTPVGNPDANRVPALAMHPETQGVSQTSSGPKVDPFQTIEICRAPSSRPPSSAAPRHQIDNAVSPTKGHEIGKVSNSDTTEFDVQVSHPVTRGLQSAAGVELQRAQPRKPQKALTGRSTPTSPVATARQHSPVAANSAPVLSGNVVQWRLTLVTLVEKLGILAKRRPLPVMAGAAVTALVMILFMVGAAKLLTPRAAPKSERVMAALPAGNVPMSQSKDVLGKEATDSSVTASSTKPSQDLDVQEVPVAIAAIPNVGQAVGHLFSGRLPEAEQAYRDLAAQFPREPAFESAARILARKNSSNCRGANLSKSSCPSVKP